MKSVQARKIVYYRYLYAIMTVYTFVTALMYRDWFESFSHQLIIFGALMAAGLLLAMKRYVISQFTLFIAVGHLLFVTANYVDYFHFYGILILMLFGISLMAIDRWQYHLGFGISLGLMVHRTYMLYTYSRDQFESHLFIMVSLIFLALLATYVDRTTMTEMKEKERLAKSSDIDLLTGLFTRMKLHKDVQSEGFDQGSYSLAVIDIDYFKSINDTYGHETGDHMLRSLADNMKKHFSEVCYDIYRWGGEEFVITCKGLAFDEFCKELDAFRKTTDRKYLGAKVHMTISIGAVSVLETETYDAAFRRCDDALYEAKDQGRNRLVRKGASA